MTNNKTRVFGLDLMRAMAIAMVLSSHILWIYNPKDEIIKRYENYRCKICNQPIPLNEVLYPDYNRGLCSFHKLQQDKEIN
jgi:hypothetical protein